MGFVEVLARVTPPQGFTSEQVLAASRKAREEILSRIPAEDWPLTNSGKYAMLKQGVAVRDRILRDA